MKVGILNKAVRKQNSGIHQHTKQLLEAAFRFGTHSYVEVGHEATTDFLPHIPIPTSWDYPKPIKTIAPPQHLKPLDWIIDTSHFGTLNRFEGVQKLGIIHDLTAITHKEYHRKRSSVAHQLFFKRAVLDCDKLVSVSKQTLHDLVVLYPEVKAKSSSAYPGFQLPSRQSEINSLKHKKFFLVVGSHEPRKNHKSILEAFEKFSTTNPDFMLVIAGDKGWKTDLNRLIELNKSKHQIINLGFVEREKLNWLYHNAFTLLYPSLYEGFGFPILEAMASGCPVISSNLSSMKEISNDAALLCDPHSADAIYSAMRNVVDDASLKKSLTEKGLSNAEKFKWEYFIEHLESAMKD